jgi:hypothetical protein
MGGHLFVVPFTGARAGAQLHDIRTEMPESLKPFEKK